MSHRMAYTHAESSLSIVFLVCLSLLRCSLKSTLTSKMTNLQFFDYLHIPLPPYLYSYMRLKYTAEQKIQCVVLSLKAKKVLRNKINGIIQNLIDILTWIPDVVWSRIQPIPCATTLIPISIFTCDGCIIFSIATELLHIRSLAENIRSPALYLLRRTVPWLCWVHVQFWNTKKTRKLAK